MELVWLEQAAVQGGGDAGSRDRPDLAEFGPAADRVNDSVLTLVLAYRTRTGTPGSPWAPTLPTIQLIALFDRRMQP